ncbi:MAG: hypothetical protein MJ151_00790, partial [Lachnospiraceae bacterium]|nr:hypothetical protein [Lachnospiraceae bacterium]
MKRFISTILHLLSIAIILVSFCLLKINFPYTSIYDMFSQDNFTDTVEYKNITSRMIDDVFTLYDYKTLYEIKGKVNYDTIVATSYKNNTYINWTLQDVI